MTTGALLGRIAAAPVSARPEALTLAPRTPASALALEGISLSFGGIQALRDVSFALAQGEIRAVIGPNGAGKSSLVNVISGLYRADTGRVVFGGKGFSHIAPEALPGLGVARTFQNLALFPGLTVAQNIAAGRAFARRSSALSYLLAARSARSEARALDQRVAAVAAELGLTPYLSRKVATLPYGLQKQVELARALIAAPKILLLDEPMAGLTAPEKSEMAAHIRAARDRWGLSVILIEHDIGVVMGLSDRVAVLDHGVKIADGTPAEVQADSQVIRAYLGAEAV